MKIHFRPLIIILIIILVLSLIPISFIFPDTCNFPFPQNAVYPYGIKPNNFSNTQMDQQCMDWFTKWKAKYVTQNNCTGSEWRLQRLETGNGITNGCYGYATSPQENDTVSEGIGYAMVIMVFMSSASNNTQSYFDGLYTYYKNNLDGAGLMNWQIPYCNSGGSATDADEDVAFALLTADKQWGTTGTTFNYKNEATTIIGRILSNEISAANDIRPGDGWDGANISYFAPYEYRMFGDYTGTSRWYSVASHTYQTIVNYYYTNSQTVNSALGISTGLQPNWCNYDGTTWSPGAWSMDPNSWWWDAIRHVWRQSYDYLLYGTLDSTYAFSNNARVSQFFQTKYNGDASKILSHYTLDGTETSYNRGDRTPDLGTEDVRNLPGPEGAVAISAMVEGDQNWLNECYYDLVTMDAGTGSGNLTETNVDWGTDYFCDILKMQYLLILTGNMPNPMGNYTPSPSPTPTNTWNVLYPTLTATPTPERGIFDDFETGNIINLDTSAGGQTAFTSVANTTDKPEAGTRSLKIISTANGWGAYGQDSPYTGGLGYQDYTGATALTFDIYTTSAITFFVKLVEGTANGADGETFSNRISQTAAAANTWVHISIPITNTAVFNRDTYSPVIGNNKLDLGAIKSFYLQIDAAPNATIWIDNILFTGSFPAYTPTATVTNTRTPFGSPTFTRTYTFTPTPSTVYSPTVTPSVSATPTDTPFISATITMTATITIIPSATITSTATPNIPFGVFDDFETGVFKNLNTTDTGGGAKIAVTNSTTTAHGGTHSMEVVTTGASGWAVATIDSPYDGGLGYRNFTGATAIDFWINAPAGTVLFLKIVETNGQQWSNRNTPVTLAVSGWQEISIPLSTFTVDAYSPTGDGDNTLDLNIIKSVTFQWDNPGSLNMYLDDIKFTGMPVPTATVTVTKTKTFTATQTPSITVSYTATPQASFTITQLDTYTTTPTVQQFSTFTETITSTGTITSTATQNVYSPSNTPTKSSTITATYTFTQTPTPSVTNTCTATQTYSSTFTFTATFSETLTNTISPTFTISPTGTPPTQTITQTITATPTATVTQTFSSTITSSPSYTSTFTNTFTATYTATFTCTPTCSQTFVLTASYTPTATPSNTAGLFSTATVTYTNTPVNTITPTATSSNTAGLLSTATVTYTNTPANTATPTATSSNTAGLLSTLTVTYTNTPANTATPILTATPAVAPNTKGVAFPNPFNPLNVPKLGFSFYCGTAAYNNIAIRVYTSSFRLVFAEDKNGTYNGHAGFDIDGKNFLNFSNGAYYYVVTGTNEYVVNKKLFRGVIDLIK